MRTFVLCCLAASLSWLAGIYFGAEWERQSAALARAGLLCDRAATCVCLKERQK